MAPKTPKCRITVLKRTINQDFANEYLDDEYKNRWLLRVLHRRPGIRATHGNANADGKPNHLISEKSPYLLQHAYNPIEMLVILSTGVHLVTLPNFNRFHRFLLGVSFELVLY